MTDRFDLRLLGLGMLGFDALPGSFLGPLLT
jgi:hypothetical protein